MWLLCIYDLPMETPEERRDYTHFRKALEREGFLRQQKSFYALQLENLNQAPPLIKQFRKDLPKYGEVRFLYMSDIGFGKQVVLVRQKRELPPEGPTLFDFA